MAGRKPIFNNIKHNKNLKNYEVTDLTSEDIMYTTESYGDSQYETGKRKNIDSYTSHNSSKRYEKYDSGDSRAYDSYTYDDQETSFISDKERNRKHSPSQIRNRSKRRPSPRRYSPSYEPSSEISSYFIKDETNDRKNTRHSRSPERNIHSGMGYNDKDINGKKRRRNETIDESEEADLNYTNLSQPKRNKEYSSQYFEKYEHDDLAGKKNRFESKLREKDNQVYAYQEAKQNAFKNNRGLSGDSLMYPEAKLKTHEYPVLVFKDLSTTKKGSKKDSDTVYLPVLVVGAKKNKISSRHSHKEMGTPKKQEDLLVYAANLNNQRNIFQANTQETHLSETRAKQIDNIMKDNRNFENYQVNVDIEKDNQSIFGGSPKSMARKSKARKSNVTAELEYKQIDEDQLHDNFPVTKDYIKVNDKVPGENQTPALGKKSASRIGNSFMSKSVDMGDINRTSRVSKVSTVKPGPSKFSALYGEQENVGQNDTEKDTNRTSQVTKVSTVKPGPSKFSALYGEQENVGQNDTEKGTTRTSHVSKVSTVKPGLSKFSNVYGESENVGQNDTEKDTTRTSRVSKVSTIKTGPSNFIALNGESENIGQSDIEDEAYKEKRNSKATTESRTSLGNTPFLETTDLPGKEQPITSGKNSMSRIGKNSMSKSVDMGKINRTSKVSKVSTVKPGLSKFSALYGEQENVGQSDIEGEAFKEKRKSKATTESRTSLVNSPVLETTHLPEENQPQTSGNKSVSRVGNTSMTKSVDMGKINRTSKVSKIYTVKPGLSNVSALYGEPENVGQNYTEKDTARTSRLSKVSTVKPGLSKFSALYGEPENVGQSDIEEEAFKEKRKSKVTTESRTSLMNTPVLETTYLPEENQPLTSGNKSVSRVGNTSMTKSVDMGKINRTSRVSKVSTVKPSIQGQGAFGYALPKEEEISSPNEIPNEELQSDTSLKPTMKGITNTLLNINRVQPPPKPYEEKLQNLSIVRESYQSKSKGPPDMNSKFVNNIERTSTLDKNEQERMQTNSIALIENPKNKQSIGQKSRSSAVQNYELENPQRHQSNLWSKIKSIGSKPRLSPNSENQKKYLSNLLSKNSNLKLSSSKENTKIYQSNLESNSSMFRLSALQENPRQYQSNPWLKKSNSKLSTGTKSKSILSRRNIKNKNYNKEGKPSVWSILKKNKTDEPKKVLQNEDPISFEETPLVEGRDDNTEMQKEQRDRQLVQEPSCDCVSKYVTYLRECTHFFLGRTLHEEFMNFLKTINT